MSQAAKLQSAETSPAEEAKPKIPRVEYRLASVSKAAAPTGADGANWCQYVIEGGASPITGWRQGSVRDVTRFAQASADELNERSAGKSVYQRGRPPKKT